MKRFFLLFAAAALAVSALAQTPKDVKYVFTEASDLNLIGIYPYQLAVPFNVCIIRPNVHKLADASAALANGIALKQLAHLIEQHNGNRFHVVSAV